MGALQRHGQHDRSLDLAPGGGGDAARPAAKVPDRDRDADYGCEFDGRLANLGITGMRTPPRPPKANAIGERIVRTIRDECLDHIIVIKERHLRLGTVVGVPSRLSGPDSLIIVGCTNEMVQEFVALLRNQTWIRIGQAPGMAADYV